MTVDGGLEHGASAVYARTGTVLRVLQPTTPRSASATEDPRWHLVRRILAAWPARRGKDRLARVLQAIAFLPRKGVVDIDGLRLRVELDEYVGHYLFTFGFDDPDVEVLRSLLRPGDTFVDVGANIGLYTLTAAQMVGEQGTVHSFEASPEIAARLRDHAALNGVPNLVIHEIAIGEHDGSVLFYGSANGNIGMGSLSSQGAKSPAVRVPCRSLDSLCADGTLTRCDLLKLDIEGAETMALRGARRLLGGPGAPRAILVEMVEHLLADLGSSTAELSYELVAHGYRLHVARAGALVPLEPAAPIHGNVWAVKAGTQ